MKVEKVILNRVEGEVSLKIQWDSYGKVSDAFVVAYNSRGFEKILEGKELPDALVITPRICGICGHAHLIATVNAIENLYMANSINIDVPQKAKLIRQITLYSEIIQNHLKWFYLFIMPDFIKLLPTAYLEDFRPFSGEKWKKAIKYSSEIVKIIAIFGGQWPHTSYAIAGGVTADPLKTDIIEALSIVDNLIKYVEKEILGIQYEEYLEIKNIEEYLAKSENGDLKKFIDLCIKSNLDTTGQS
ncbi:nickel-dependent hydrogenase large subunit, partial [Sulfurihydrogenibium sp.]|uniref:nickel-dependent hydrogenase large subunit n=1 Tax=Sulfurihydrogenibium sp. TaxID=2053621 RepID=UPI0026126D5A